MMRIIKINLGDRIYTPMDKIEESMIYRPEYSSNGLIKKWLFFEII